MHVDINRKRPTDGRFKLFSVDFLLFENKKSSPQWWYSSTSKSKSTKSTCSILIQVRWKHWAYPFCDIFSQRIPLRKSSEPKNRARKNIYRAQIVIISWFRSSKFELWLGAPFLVLLDSSFVFAIVHVTVNDIEIPYQNSRVAGFHAKVLDHFYR